MEKPDAKQLVEYASRMMRGTQLGDEFAEDNQWASDGSSISALLKVTLEFEDPRYTSQDARFVVECLRAYMAISSAQMRGLAALLLAGPPVQLHPLMTLIRAQAEACGSAWWLLGPLLDDANEGGSTVNDELIARNFDALDRSKILFLQQLRARLSRLRIDGGEAFDDVANQLVRYEGELVALHGDAGLKWSYRRDGSPKEIIGIGAAQPPQLTEVVMIAVEYAYGQAHRGEGINLYKLFSGYAHGSIEMFFSHGQTAWLSLVRQADASGPEVRDFSNLVLRMHYQLLETLVRIMGRDVGAVDAWGAEWWDTTLGDETKDRTCPEEE